MIPQDDWDWKLIRFELFNALDCLPIHEIFLVEKEENIVAISIITEEVELLKPLTRMRIIDGLIAEKAPALHSRYLFCYEIWDRKEWERFPVKKYFHRP